MVSKASYSRTVRYDEAQARGVVLLRENPFLAG